MQDFQDFFLSGNIVKPQIHPANPINHGYPASDIFLYNLLKNFASKSRPEFVLNTFKAISSYSGNKVVVM